MDGPDPHHEGARAGRRLRRSPPLPKWCAATRSRWSAATPNPGFRARRPARQALRQRQRGADPVALPRTAICATPASTRRGSSGVIGRRHGRERRRPRTPAARRGAAVRAVCRAGGAAAAGMSGCRRARAAAPATPCSPRRAQRLAADPEPFRRMVRAIYRTQQWVAAKPPAALAAAIAGYFPALDRGVLTGALGPLQGAGRVGRRPDPARGGLRPAAPRAARQRLSLPRGAVRRLRRQPAGGGCNKACLNFVEQFNEPQLSRTWYGVARGLAELPRRLLTIAAAALAA